MATTTLVCVKNEESPSAGNIYIDDEGDLCVLCKNPVGIRYVVYFTGTDIGKPRSFDPSKLILVKAFKAEVILH